jgi:hypothetical protein
LRPDAESEVENILDEDLGFQKASAKNAARENVEPEYL